MDEEEECELSPDQLEKLMQYQEVTGVEDVSFARFQLIEHNWNVETAVQNHLSIHDSPQRTSPSLRPRSQSFPNSSSSTNDLETERMNLQSRQEPSPSLYILPARTIRGIFGWCYFLLSFPMKLIYSFFYTLFFPYPYRSDPLDDVTSFVREYESVHGTQHPNFYHGSYNQALNSAKTELKFLLVYLHCKDHQDTPKFCSDVMSDSTLIEYINSNVIFWGCSVHTSEGYRVSQALREDGYPFFALIVLKNNKMTVVGRFRGYLTASTLMDRLQTTIRDSEAYLVVARADRQEREMNAALRQEQDAAYLESLRVDQEKARKRQEEKEAESKQREEEREHEQSIIEEREQRRKLKIEWADRIAQEPEEGEEGIVHIVAKLPQGTRLNRRFKGSDSLSALYYYIFCHPDSPDKFQVTTNFPRKHVPCEPVDGESVTTTFNDFALPPRTMLFVIDLDA